MTKDEWMQLADIALQAAVFTLRQEAKRSKDAAGKHAMHVTADYCESIRDQRPKGK